MPFTVNHSCFVSHNGTFSFYTNYALVELQERKIISDEVMVNVLAAVLLK